MPKDVASPQSPKADSSLRRGWSTKRFGNFFRSAVLAMIPVAVGLTLASALHESDLVNRLHNLVFDQYQRWQPRLWTPDLPVRVADIDDTSLDKIGQWPWPRQRLAELTDKLAAAGAAAIVFDALFSEEDQYAPKQMLSRLPDIPERDALEKAMQAQSLLDVDPLAHAFENAPVVSAVALTDLAIQGKPETKAHFVLAGDDPTPALPHFQNMILPLAHLREAAKGLGVINYIPDGDQVIRRAPIAFAVGPPGQTVLAPSLGVEALRVAFQTLTPILKSTNASGEISYGSGVAVVSTKIGEAEIPTEADGAVRIYFAGTHDGRRIPAWRILSGDIDSDEIAGRIVLIGSSANALADLRATPLESVVPGVDIHAEFLEHALSGAQLVRLDWAWAVESLAVIMGGLLLTLTAALLPPIGSALAALVVVGGGALASWLAFSQAQLLFDPIIPGATWLAAYATATVGVFRRTTRERREVRAAFSRYLSPVVVEQLAADPSRLRLGGEARNVTILFSDVRGFTSRAETMTGAGVVHFLNALHTPLTGCVLSEGGTIDKYIGDGLMAFWNAPLDIANHANAACRAALAMAAAVPSIYARMSAEAATEGRDHAPLRIGIGLNTGDVFVGNMGSEQRFDYSIVGDPVNIAARLESATKEFGVTILASEATRQAAGDFRFVDLGDAGLKGKASAVRVYALHGPKSEADDAWDEFCDLHRAVLEALAGDRLELEARLVRAAGHPLGFKYAGFYDRLRDAKAPEIGDGEFRPGGS